MDSNVSPIKLDEDVLFIESEWIGQNKIYANVPDFVRWQKEKDMEIPLDILQFTNFPKPEFSVNDFLAHNFPRISSEIISNNVACWFSKNAPNDLDMQTLLQRSIPSPAFLAQIEEAVGQAWLDGAKSVVDWRINDGTTFLPLWIITFWRKVERLCGIQVMWNQSLKWLSNEEARKQKGKSAVLSGQIQTTHELLGSLQWNGKMDYCNKQTSTSQLSRFLGTFWLSDDHINMMVEEMLRDLHIERSGDTKYIHVASLSFAHELQSVEKKLALPLSMRRKTLLHKYELRVKDGLQKLYFPIHISKNHWIVGMVNFKKKSIAFGEDQYLIPLMFDDCTNQIPSRSSLCYEQRFWCSDQIHCIITNLAQSFI